MKKLILLGFLAALVSCPGSTASVVVSPKTRTLTAGSAAVNFTATVTGLNNPTPIWTLEGNSQTKGTLVSNAGLTVTYTPPTSVNGSQTVNLVASVGVFNDTAVITVIPGQQQAGR